jgi:hypothetical protein
MPRSIGLVLAGLDRRPCTAAFAGRTAPAPLMAEMDPAPRRLSLPRRRSAMEGAALAMAGLLERHVGASRGIERTGGLLVDRRGAF